MLHEPASCARPATAACSTAAHLVNTRRLMAARSAAPAGSTSIGCSASSSATSAMHLALICAKLSPTLSLLHSELLSWQLPGPLRPSGLQCSGNVRSHSQPSERTGHPAPAPPASVAVATQSAWPSPCCSGAAGAACARLKRQCRRCSSPTKHSSAFASSSTWVKCMCRGLRQGPWVSGFSCEIFRTASWNGKLAEQPGIIHTADVESIFGK